MFLIYITISITTTPSHPPRDYLLNLDPHTSTYRLTLDLPTYGYELAQAVKDGFLVDFVSVETKLKFIDKGS